MIFRSKKILIVGGGGFIGGYLQDELYLSRPMILDLRFGQDAREGISGKWDTIVFLACNQERTEKAKAYNIELYKALDAYMNHYPKTHVIFTSSAAVYGDSDKPLDEKSLTGPANVYGQSKLIGEAYVQQYQHHTILRLSNVCGHGDGYGVCDRFLRGETRIFGDGKDVRDFVQVEEVVDVIALAVKVPKKWQGITNISSGIGTTVLEAFESFGKGEPVFVKRRTGDVKYSVLSNGKMQRLLND